MKTKSIIAMSLMAALAAGCSSDDIVDDGGKKPGAVEGTAYVGLNITLPSTNGTRSEDYNYDPGTSDEYKVNDLKITFYYTENSEAKKQVVNYDIKDIAWEKSSETGITAKALLPVTTVNFLGAAQAVVEINSEGLGIDIDDYTTPKTDKTAKDFIGGNNKNSFFMTNTVREDGKYLVDVKSYETKLEAQNNASKYDIRVERAVAKVEVKLGANFNPTSGNNYTITTEGSAYKDANVKISNWQLDVTNKKMFPIRHFGGTTDFPNETGKYSRFYDEIATNVFRTGWAIDPNYNNYEYSAEAETKNFNRIPSVGEINNTVGTTAADGTVEYCFENTFNVAHQKQNETTRAVVKAKFIPKNFSEDMTWYTFGNSTQAYAVNMINAKIESLLNLDPGKVEFKADQAAGTKELLRQDIKVDKGSGKDYISEADLAIVKNALGNLTTYVNGYCYYAIRIQHMANFCTWGTNTQKDKYGTPYVDYTAATDDMAYDFTGRYGVVRNNWYKITINDVSQPGSPTLPELNGRPDDEQYYYLQANISIEDWAVREQGVTL